MRCRPLTASSELRADAYGRTRLVSSYEWHGQTIDICDSARNILSLLDLFADEQKSIQEKDAELEDRLFFDPVAVAVAVGDDIQELVEDAMWDVCGLDITPDLRYIDESEDPAFDWHEDADRIRASLLSAYGLDWDEAADTCSFAHILSLLTSLMESGESPFQQAIAYRSSDPPKRTKSNDDLVDAWIARQEHFALKGSDPASTQNDAMADMFAAAERAAMEAR